MLAEPMLVVLADGNEPQLRAAGRRSIQHAVGPEPSRLAPRSLHRGRVLIDERGPCIGWPSTSKRSVSCDVALAGRKQIGRLRAGSSTARSTLRFQNICSEGVRHEAVRRDAPLHRADVELSTHDGLLRRTPGAPISCLWSRSCTRRPTVRPCSRRRQRRRGDGRDLRAAPRRPAVTSDSAREKDQEDRRRCVSGEPLKLCSNRPTAKSSGAVHLPHVRLRQSSAAVVRAAVSRPSVDRAKARRPRPAALCIKETRSPRAERGRTCIASARRACRRRSTLAEATRP